jgi:hypothetical protein
MCNHQHKKSYINGLSETCQIPTYFTKIADQDHEYTDLPLDEKGKCIFHSTNLKWKRTNNCGDRFWELLQIMAKDEILQDIDFREFILTGLDFGENHGYQKGAVPLEGECIIPIGRLHIKAPLRMQGAKFHDNLLLQDMQFEAAVDFDEAIFKGVVTIECCNFKGMVSFINGCRMEHNFIVEDCSFEESADFHNLVAMQQVYFTDVLFGAEVMFVGLSQIAPDLICSFTQVTFSEYTSFSDAGFNSSLAFDNCRFLGEVHFENTAFRKRLQVLEPLIADKIFIMGTKPGVKLFENAVDFELSLESFEGVGQLIFKNVNLFNFDASFKSQLKELELNHKIDLREGCILYRTSVERIFPYSRFNKIILEDISNALASFFESLYNRSLQIDLTRDLKKNEIKLLFHTEENISIAELQSLIFQTKENILEFLEDPNPQLKKAASPATWIDHFLQLKSIWERYQLAEANELLESPILESLITGDGQAIDEKLKELFGITVNIYGKNLIINSQIDAKGNILIGDTKT